MHRQIPFIEKPQFDSLGRNGYLLTHGVELRSVQAGWGEEEPEEVHVRPMTSRGGVAQALVVVHADASADVGVFFAQAFARNAVPEARALLLARMEVVCEGHGDPSRLAEQGGQAQPLPEPCLPSDPPRGMPDPGLRRVRYPDKTHCDSVGRNGHMLTHGCSLSYMEFTGHSAEIHLSPVTSRGEVGRACVVVHADAAGDVAAFLAEAVVRNAVKAGMAEQASAVFLARMRAVCSGEADPGADMDPDMDGPEVHWPGP